MPIRKIAEEPLMFIKLENDVTSTDTKTVELENFWTDIHALTQTRSWKKGSVEPRFSFEVLSDGKGARFYMGVPKRYINVISKKLNAVYPAIDIQEVEDPLNQFIYLKEGETSYSYELVLAADNTLPLKMKNADKTFLNSLINSMNHLGTNDRTLVQITVRPTRNKSFRNILGNKISSSPLPVQAAISVIKTIMKFMGWFLFYGGQDTKTAQFKAANQKWGDAALIDKTMKPAFDVSIRITSKSTDNLIAEDTSRSVASVFRELDDQNSLQPIKINFFPVQERAEGHNRICVNELSQFAYLPTKSTSADSVTRGGIKMMFDKNIPNEGLVFGDSNGRPVAFPMKKISLADYEKMYRDIEKIIDNICKPRLILGQMGTGKSEFIINYCIELIKMGVSAIVVDPKHDTQKRLIESIPEEYMHLVDYIDLGDLTFPAAMNLLRLRHPGDQTEISMVTQTFINFMKKLYGNAWGYSMQLLIQNVVNTILLTDIHTLYEFQLLLTNEEYRSNIIDKLKELLADRTITGKAMIQECLDFWIPFHGMSDKDRMDRIKSTMNRIGLFMANRLIRAIVSQRESYDFRAAGDMGRITIVNLSEGILGPENTAIMSSFINKAIWLDFQSRADQPDMAKRYPTMWLIDEAHTLVDEEFIGVLTKSRSYRLGLTLITQGLTNFKHSRVDNLDELILTNCKNKILFRVGNLDARLLADEFAPLTMYDLNNIPDYHFYGKILLEGGKVSQPFFAHAPLPAPVLRNYEEYVEKHRAGKMTIDEVEEDTRLRHGLKSRVTMFSAAVAMGSDEDEKTTKKRNKQAVLEV